MTVRTWLRNHTPALRARTSAATGFDADPFTTLQAEIDRVFEEFGRALPLASPRTFAALSPRIDVVGRDGVLEVTAEVPGVDENQIDISVEGETLVLQGEKASSSVRDEDDLHVIERTYGAFRRDIPLGFAVDPDAITAKAKKGVLTITIPMPATTKPNGARIPVKVED